MAEFKNYKEVAFLLSKAVQGQLTEKEEETLGKWRQEFPENELLYRQVLTSEFIISKSKQWEQVDLVMAYLKVRQKCEHRLRRARLFQVTAVAVSVLLLLVSGLFYFVLRDKSDRYPVGLMTENILPGNAKAELILADGERILLGGPGMDSVLVQPGAEIHTAKERLSYIGRQQTGKIQYNILQIPRGGEYSVTLQDGTVVNLNSASELRYPVAFSGDLREVELRGEAYFEVAENKNKPFIVRTDEFNVRVLGTSFNISAYADSPLALTTLCSGQVQLTDCMNPKNEQDLLPGEQLLFHRESRKMEIRNVDTDVFVSWREGFFQFDNHTVEEVFMILQRWYNVQVFYANTEVRLDCFTGKLPRFDNMMIIIDLIKRVSDLKITVDGKVIYIDK